MSDVSGVRGPRFGNFGDVGDEVLRRMAPYVAGSWAIVYL